MKRYVAAMIRSAKTDEGLTEENFKVGASSQGALSRHCSELTVNLKGENLHQVSKKLCSLTSKQAHIVDICSTFININTNVHRQLA